MRSELLFPIFASLESLNGVGGATAEKLGKLCGSRIFDLLSVRPYGVIDRRHCPLISSVQHGMVASFVVTIESVQSPRQRHLPSKVVCANDSGVLDLVFFHQRGDYISKKFKVGEEFIISGRVEINKNRAQITHPDYALPVAQKEAVMRIEPQYPLTAGISQNKMQNMMLQSVERIPELAEWQQSPKLSFKEALLKTHAPQSDLDLEPSASATLRLAYDELLAHQLVQAISYQKNKQHSSVIAHDKILQQQLTAALPFTLTQGQEDAVEEIGEDMASGKKMMRLLQGDVGSGKTIVALLAAIPLVEAGYQIAFMMPTTLLANQQLAATRKFLKDMDVRAELLTGNVKGKAREEVLRALAAGEIDIIIGTHALFQDHVEFNDLGLTIIDEQHRFGVEQRLRLSEKNPVSHILLMSATPIPRTLTMAFFGDMDVSRITEKPANRKPINTIALPIGRIADIYASIHRALGKDEKIYWICPLVEESEKVHLANVTERFSSLRKEFGSTVGLVHGKMKEDEKAAILQKFYDGEIKILVATTVIEVGIDVPDATIILIENANNFGLSQLHQLRGRVGRGAKASTCILLYDGKPGPTGQARLKILKDSEDGFEIAEEDLNLRGSGEVLGTRQSGELSFSFAELPTHKNLLIEAREDAREIISNDRDFKTSRGKNLRVLMQLFNFEANLRYTNS